MTTNIRLLDVLVLLVFSLALPGWADAYFSIYEAYIGEIQLFALSFCPAGTVETDGRSSGIPDLRKSVPQPGMRYCVNQAGVSPQSSKDHSNGGYLGQILLLVGGSCPADYVEPDGRQLVSNDFQALYSLLGHTFGGVTYRTFTLPKLSPPAPVTRYCFSINAINGVYPPIYQGYHSYRDIVEFNAGQLLLLPYRCPAGTVEADGRVMPLQENPMLYSLLGHTFGGDGRYTFAVPDLRRATPQGMHYCLVTAGSFPQRP